MNDRRARIVIGFGGNVGGEDAVVARFRQAREALASLGTVRSAALYRTEPLGPDQPAFLNTAVSLRLEEPQARELADTLREIERLLGREREREVRWGPRTIDLDILAWGTGSDVARVIRASEPGGIDVPHPRVGERRFALAPLVDLVGEDVELPGVGRVGDALARVYAQHVELIRETW
ncbi:MAG: 2-amino-4-hydroxy-6-hydroxymethyldihydropteridine diphosphokinase [Kofleriaceae bacterium]